MFSGSNIHFCEQIMSLIEAEYNLVIRNVTVILKVCNFFTNFILMACLFKLYQANYNAENARSRWELLGLLNTESCTNHKE